MKDRFSFVVPVVTAAVISVAFWMVMTSIIAWSLVFLTGALNSSGLTQIPALSFWQSVGVLLLVFLLSVPLRAGRSNKEDKGER